ncbi:hypothetical protein ABS767_01715 [Sphingomonas sp. ST-64]|uniref:Uncharacterized protein n=1 Tax=Sphingomonas plantiphila TaxID=3163295 RepID=A0ABW8YIE4_9SPHN
MRASAHTPVPLALALLGVSLAATPAAAQRLGTPTHSQQNEDGLRTTKAVEAGTEAGEKVESVVVNAGETKVLRVAPGADGTVEAFVLSGTPSTVLKVTVSFKGGTTTLKAANSTGGTVGFTIEGDTSGSGSWAQAGEVKDLKNRQSSSTDYQVELKAVRLSGFTYTKK